MESLLRLKGKPFLALVVVSFFLSSALFPSKHNENLEMPGEITTTGERKIDRSQLTLETQEQALALFLTDLLFEERLNSVVIVLPLNLFIPCKDIKPGPPNVLTLHVV